MTGTAAWSYVAISQYILGIKPVYDGLIIDPCIPKNWKQFYVKRQFRGTVYHIYVENPHGISKGIKELIVDGKSISGNKIPIYHDKKEHKIQTSLR